MEQRRQTVVVGAGAAGLVAAAELRRRGVEVLVLERGGGVGESWRARYQGLRLNTVRQLSSIRGLRIPRSAGRYPSREAFIAYLEDYARRHDIEVELGVTARRIDREPDGDWRLRTDGAELVGRHVVVATGWDCEPCVPAWPGRDGFAGELIHAAALPAWARAARRSSRRAGRQGSAPAFARSARAPRRAAALLRRLDLPDRPEHPALLRAGAPGGEGREPLTELEGSGGCPSASASPSSRTRPTSA